ncbi:hypothetical protein ANAEL_05003 [Anaerolineales bacterium]|nr:hypothetical protein ANAEL_05003 [Anaerolineales bacterium]
MAQTQASPVDQGTDSRKVAIGLWAVFIAYFAPYFFLNGINIAQPNMVEEFKGMALFAWLIALPALGSAVAALLFGKLSDMYGRRAILLISLGLFLVGAILSIISTSMNFAIVARVVLALGQGAIAPMCF